MSKPSALDVLVGETHSLRRNSDQTKDWNRYFFTRYGEDVRVCDIPVHEMLEYEEDQRKRSRLLRRLDMLIEILQRHVYEEADILTERLSWTGEDNQDG